MSKPSPAFEEAQQRLRDEDEEVRHLAVQGLAPFGSEAVPLLSEALGDGSWRVRKAALEALLAMPAPPPIDLFLDGIRDEKSAGRRNTWSAWRGPCTRRTDTASCTGT